MRASWAYAFSGFVHVFGLTVLAFWLPPLPDLRMQFRAGDSVVLNATFSEPVEAAPEPVALAVEAVEPMEPPPAPELETSRVDPSNFEMVAATVTLDKSELEVDMDRKTVEQEAVDQPVVVTVKRRVANAPADVPKVEATAIDAQPMREVDQPTIAKVELSLAVPFQAASDLGSKVDSLPSPHPLNRKPDYPLDALRARIEGVVSLRVQIDSAGRVTRVQLERSSGAPSLDQSAISGVMQWRFSPARRGGLSVPYEVIVPVRFTIRG
jgi:periplasmic protein TonB